MLRFIHPNKVSIIQLGIGFLSSKFRYVSVALAGVSAKWALLLLLGAFSSAIRADSATDLAHKIYNRPSGDDAVTRAVMTLKEKGRSPRTRELYTFAKDFGGGKRWSLARFTRPADIDGVGLLTKDRPGDDSDQWLYLPALDRVRRVSSSRKGGRFVGSDLFFEDLRDREPDMDTHRLAGKEKIGKLLCDKLISVPVKKSNSAYTKRVSWVHPKTLIALRVEFYQKRSKKPVKRLDVKKIKRIQGVWTVTDSVMRDLKTGHQTRITARKVKYNQKLPDRLFSTKTLSDDSVDKRYRP